MIRLEPELAAHLKSEPIVPEVLRIATAEDPFALPLPSIPAEECERARLDSRRLWMAFVLTPMLSGIYPAIFLAEPSVMPLGLLLAYTWAMVVGLPLVLWFDRRYWRSWWQFAAGGAACTLPTMALYALLKPPAHLEPFGWLPALGLLFWGSASGLVFWLIGVTGETPVSVRSLLDPLATKRGSPGPTRIIRANADHPGQR
ncbi:MAG TPA: hypothetical protein VGL55_01885 [Steroidobacteraceae bacterium]